jgi:phage terminase large subunit
LSKLQIETPQVFEPLLGPARYKGAYGGRGSGKSHFFGELLIEDHLRERGLLSVCIREVQKSLKDSAYRLLTSKLEKFRLGERDGFKVFNDRIETPGDGVIVFQGMQDHTAESIKSLEGFKRAWVEEAQTLSSISLKLLRPTIRAEGSEIWCSWNPRHKKDPVDAMLRSGIAPTNSVVVRANWSDNPYFPSVLEQERLDCLRDDPDQYENIWEGDYISVAEGAYYAQQIAKARVEKRIDEEIAVDPYLTVKLFCDIGGAGSKSDAFSIWAVQFISQSIYLVNYYEAQGQTIGAHLAWMRECGYNPDNTEVWLPHDGETSDKVFAVSYQSAFESAGYSVEVIPNQGRGAAKQRIEAGRRLFPRMHFDKKCQPGLEALGWYHEKKDDIRQIGLGPEHDWSSHCADAFGYMCIAYNPPKKRKPINYQRISVA